MYTPTPKFAVGDFVYRISKFVTPENKFYEIQAIRTEGPHPVSYSVINTSTGAPTQIPETSLELCVKADTPEPETAPAPKAAYSLKISHGRLIFKTGKNHLFNLGADRDSEKDLRLISQAYEEAANYLNNYLETSAHINNERARKLYEVSVTHARNPALWEDLTPEDRLKWSDNLEEFDKL